MKKILFLTMILIVLSSGKALALKESTALFALKPFMYGESVDQRIVASHNPIYPRTGDSAVYMAVGNVNGNGPPTPSTLGIKRIRIWVKVYQIILNASGERELIPKSESSKLCEYPEPYPKVKACSYPHAELPNDAYVWYQASMRLSNDTLYKDHKITHTAKLSAAVKASYNDAYPVYSRGIDAEKFNILFTAATDYVSETGYLNDVQDFVYNGLFTGYRIRKLRRFFNIYVNDFPNKVTISNPDGNACSDASITDQKPDNWDDLSGIDVHIYAHAVGFQDCAQNGLGGGRICSADTPDAAVHEMLHALIGAGDEYPGSNGDVAGNHPNVFDSEEACVDHAEEFHPTKYAASPGCRSLGMLSPIFHWCPESDIMDSGSGPLETEEWYSFYDQIDQHNLSAFSTVRDPTVNEDAEEVALDSEASIKAKIEEARWKKSQKTLSLYLRFKGPAVILEKFKIINGVAAPRIFYPKLKSDYLVSLFDNQGNLIQDFWTQDPRHIASEEVTRGTVSPPIQELSFNLRIAWQSNMARFRIQNREGKILLEAPLLETQVPAKTAPSN